MFVRAFLAPLFAFFLILLTTFLFTGINQMVLSQKCKGRIKHRQVDERSGRLIHF